MNLGLLGFPRGLPGELRYWLVPIGAGFDFWGPESAVPRGYALPIGQVIPTLQAPRWTKMNGSTFGGDGVNTTGLPDKRGRVSAARDNMGGTAANRLTTGASGIDGTLLGASGGSETVPLSTIHLAAHNHGISDPGHGHSFNDYFQVTNISATAQFATVGAKTPHADGVTALSESGPTTPNSTAGAGTGISTTNTGSGTAHQNTQATIVCNYIIRIG